MAQPATPEAVRQEIGQVRAGTGVAARGAVDLLRRFAATVGESARFAIWLLVEPQETFYHLREKGSVAAALVIMFLALAVRVATVFTVAFHFSAAEPWEVNFVAELMRMIAPWLTWVVANYAVTAILYGEGTFRQIFVTSAYCFVPYVLFIFPLSLLTNVLALSEAGLVYVVQTVVYGWIAVLFFLQVKVVHGYDLRATFGVVALTLAAMLGIWMVGSMIYGLSYQLFRFIREIFIEVVIRWA